ncbi:hydroxyacid dehydrogenase, partial [Candidatus Gottesmanbacteria bacterium]|nr:hydroxyacid dehydrogenase [Candidatus Gottesmanbacteria bacterium]
MKIAFFETEEWEKKYLEKALVGHQLVFNASSLTAEVASEAIDCDALSTFIYSLLRGDLLARFSNLKLISTRSTGYDHIDLIYCKNKGVTVCNVPTYGVNTIAEHTFALMLALTRKLVLSVDRTRRGNFTLDGLRGVELAGKTLGVVGFGHIGKRVAELAKAFRMKVIVYTRHPEKPSPDVPVQFVDLSTLLGTSDIVSLHVPLTPETKHLLNKENIRLMKKGSVLINTARGEIVETEAILWALEQGVLSGAGLDVLEEECVLKEERALLTHEFLATCDLKTQLLNHVLITKENVIITPHNA